VTVLEIIQKSTGFLTKKGVESPRLQGESILAHVLGVPRMQLYLSFERELSDAEVSACREMVQRRANRVPLQHLLGSVSFCGLEITVGRQALIPRPETEQLVEHAEACISKSTSPSHRILDFGTGTGCIAVALAQRNPSVRISATDISAEALDLARSNAAAHGVEDRIQFFEGDGFCALPGDARFDLIVSNPPYIPSGEIATLAPEVKDHDPGIALDGGKDGLNFYHSLATEAPAFLDPGGSLMVEFGDGQANAITDILADKKWIVAPPGSDYSGRERFLIVRLPSSKKQI